jgi:MerR family transcriptional regulator, light-induced transcriptional regulator
MTTITANQWAAHVLRVRAPALAKSIAAGHFRRRPELAARYGPAGPQRCLEDAMFHLQFLAGSVEIGDPQVFADYTAWAADLLERRRIPVEHVAENLEVMGDVLRQSVPSEALSVMQPHLDAAVSRLCAAGDQRAGQADALSRVRPPPNRPQVSEDARRA